MTAGMHWRRLSSLRRTHRPKSSMRGLRQIPWHSSSCQCSNAYRRTRWTRVCSVVVWRDTRIIYLFIIVIRLRYSFVCPSWLCGSKDGDLILRILTKMPTPIWRRPQTSGEHACGEGDVGT